MGIRRQWVLPAPPERGQWFTITQVVNNLANTNVHPNEFIEDYVSTLLTCTWDTYSGPVGPEEYPEKWIGEDFWCKLIDALEQWCIRKGVDLSTADGQDELEDWANMLSVDTDQIYPWMETVYMEYLVDIRKQYKIEKIIESRVVGNALIIIGEVR